MNAIRNTLLALTCGAFLAACSGNDNSLNGTNAPNQAHQVIPAQKTTTLTAASYQNVAQAMYLAYFGRPADPAGLANVEATLLAANAPTDAAGLATAYSANASVQALVNGFASSKESQSLYNTTAPAAFVNDVYEYLFDRAPAASGLSFWTDAISSGSLNQAAAALAIMGASATNNSTQGQTDAQTVANRLSFASQFTAELSSQNLTNDYVGSTVSTDIRAMVATITASTTASQITTDVLDCIQQLEASGATASVTLNAVTWSGTQYVAVGVGGIVETSPDGVTWTNRGSAFGTQYSAADLRGVVWQNNRFLTVGVTGGLESCTGEVACPGAVQARQDSVLSSTDGITWTSSLSSASLANIPVNSELNSVIWDGSEFVAVGDQIIGTPFDLVDYGHVLVSTDGLNWSITTQYSGASNTTGTLPALVGVAWSGAQLATVGNGIFTAANGNAWTANSLAGSYTGIASSGTIFVATGLSGALYSSTDGQTWTQHAVTTLDLYNVAWSGTQFVAVGAGVILTSPDGLSWTIRNAGTSNHLYGVTWSGTQFVAVGVGTVVTSPDGVTWTAQTVN